MMSDLNNLLSNYKELTIQLIEEVSDVENLGKLIEKRAEIIDSIKSLEYNPEDFKILVSQLGIIEKEEELIHKVKKEKVNVKKSIDNVQKLKKVQGMYLREEGAAVYFNMKSY